MARPTYAETADYYRQEWLCERDGAETQPCPPRAEGGCDAPAGRTCVNPITGRQLQGPPAHPARIRRARVAADLAARIPTPRTAA